MAMNQLLQFGIDLTKLLQVKEGLDNHLTREIIKAYVESSICNLNSFPRFRQNTMQSLKSFIYYMVTEVEVGAYIDATNSKSSEIQQKKDLLHLTNQGILRLNNYNCMSPQLSWQSKRLLIFGSSVRARAGSLINQYLPCNLILILMLANQITIS